MLKTFKVMISLKKILSHKNQDKFLIYVKFHIQLKFFDIILPNQDPRQEDKKMAKISRTDHK